MNWQPIDTVPTDRAVKLRRAGGAEVEGIQLAKPSERAPHGEWIVKGDPSDEPFVEWAEK
jgi:hypothetical protein